MKSKIIIPLILFLFSCAQHLQNSGFVELKKVNPNIILDIRYATENNFLERPVYPSARCFVLKTVAFKLDSIQKELEQRGLGLKIYDGYRPLSVQKQMWQILPDSRYVANPVKGSRHNRGAAVDVTLVDSNGVELEMPTGFDDFTQRAAHGFMDLPGQVIKNRELLRTIMEKHGFVHLKSEWWHYDLKNYDQYPVVDYSFDDLEKMKKVIKK